MAPASRSSPFEPRIGSALLLVTSLLVFAATSSIAQPLTLRVRPLGPEDGLAQGTVYAIEQDSNGFLWFGTQNGLHRFDGRDFVVFEHVAGEPDSLAHNHVQALAEDTAGRLWVGTDDGLDIYDRQSDSFVHVAAEANQRQIRSLAFDRSGTLWVGSTAGLGKVENRSPPTLASVAPDWTGGDPGTVYAVLPIPSAAGSEGSSEGPALLLGTDAGLLRFDAGRWTRVDGVSGAVRALLLDRSGRLWIGGEEGLARREASGELRRFRADPDDPRSLPKASVRSLLETRDERIWVGTFGGGLALFDPITESFVRYRHRDDDPWSLSQDQILSLFQDRSGLVWIGTVLEGVDRWDPRSWQFQPIRRRPGESATLGGDVVTAFAEDPAGDVWIGTYEGGLSRWHRAQGDFSVFRHDPDDPRSLATDQVGALVVDRSGTLWIGTQTAGLDRFDRRTRTFRHYPPRPEPGLGPGAAGIVCLLEDHDGRLWLGTFGGGLDRFDPATGRFENHRHDPADPTSLGHDTVLALARDAEGRLWIGTRGAGLDLYDPARGGFRHFRHDENDGTSLPSDTLTALLAEENGLWIATNGAGLAFLERFDPRTDEASFRHWTERDGLADDTILGLQPDPRGGLWLSSNRGLSRFDIATEKSTHYGVRHGLQGREFTFGAHYGGSDGELFFGGIEGFNAFDPARLDFTSPPPPVALVGLELSNRPVVVPATNAPGPLDLTHRDRSVTFEFAALDFVAPEENRYSYQLEGFDEDWIETARRRATYTNLDAGEYTFRVRATSADGATNEEGLAVRLAVTPAPWNTWWARALYFVVGLGLLSLGVRWRLAELERRSTELEKLVARRTGELSETVERLRVSESAAVEARRRALRSLEEALQERRKAQNASQAKSQFLSSMSHELRTPLNAILGFAQLMERDTDLRSEHRESLSIILRGGEHLLGLVNDVLSLSKIEAGKLALIEEPFDPRRVLCDLESLVRGRAEAKGLQLGVEIAPELPPALHGDAGRLQQVLLNLLGNAVKFTDRGRIDLHLAYQGGVATFEVADTGRGIDPAELERLFEPFAQTGAASDEGTGLGLAISQELVRLMGGDLEVDSALGKGSTFRFAVPLAPADPERVAVPRGRVVSLIADGEAPKILVVDDAEENRRLLERLLGRVGFTVESAGDGREAVETWRRWRPDLVFMDIRMPGVDGYEATRRIRRLEAEEGLEATAIVALTATAFEHDRRTILEAGCDDVVTKPFRDTQLFETLAEHLEIRFRHADLEDEGGKAPARTSTPRLRPKAPERATATDDVESTGAKSSARRILVAEDNPANQMVARRMLERLGHAVDVVANGLDAVAAFEREPVDLVLMDVRMPGIDGLEATRRIRASRVALRQPAIVALTGLASDDERQLCYTAGMDDVLAKPFRLDDLRTTVERWLDAGPRERSRESAKEPKTEPIRVDRRRLDTLGPEAAEAGATSGSPIDLGKLDQLRELDDGTAKPLASQIISLYLDTVPDQLDELRRAVVEGNRHRWRRLAHSLKNSSATLGADGVSAACKELEALGRQVDTDGVLRSRALAVLDRLVTELRRALDALEIERRRVEDSGSTGRG